MWDTLLASVRPFLLVGQECGLVYYYYYYY